PPDVTHETEPPQTTPRVTEPGTAGGSPNENVSELARGTDHSLKSRTATARGVDRLDPRSVAWVRLSDAFSASTVQLAGLGRRFDALSASTAQLAGSGISFEAELHRRIRRFPVQTVAASRTASSNRVSKLPPLSAFGRPRPHGVSAPQRSGVGMAR